MTYVRGVPEGHPQDTRIALFVTNKGCSRAYYFTNVLLQYVFMICCRVLRRGWQGAKTTLQHPTESAVFFVVATTAVAPVSRWNVVAVYYYSSCEDRTGGRLAVGFRHVYMDIALQVGGDSFAQQRARPDFVTETESGDDDCTTATTKRNRCAARRTQTHTHTHKRTRARARYTNTQQHTSARYTLHAPGPVGDRHTTGARGHCTTATTVTTRRRR